MPAPPLVEPPACSRSMADITSDLCMTRGRWEYQARRRGVDNHGDMVILAELFDQALQAPLDQWELVGFVHRTGDVDQKDEITRWPL